MKVVLDRRGLKRQSMVLTPDTSTLGSQEKKVFDILPPISVDNLSKIPSSEKGIWSIIFISCYCLSVSEID